MPLDSSQQEAKVESERKGALTAIIRVAGGCRNQGKVNQMSLISRPQ